MTMREPTWSANRPTGRETGVVLLCDESDLARVTSDQLSQLNIGSVITYASPADLTGNRPAGPVALVVFALSQFSAEASGLLGWARNRWPRSSVVVVGDAHSPEWELQARCSGALYLVRPVPTEAWLGVAAPVWQRRARTSA